MTAIEVKNLSFAYGERTVFEEVSFSIDKGEYVALLGPNGSGKSTLLKLLLGLLKPCQGSILLFGQPAAAFKKEGIGYLPQRASSFDQRFPATVEEVVGMYGGEDADLAWALEKVDLKAERKRLIGQLSGGQQQRALVARALAGRPKLLILDEPSANLDPRGQYELYQLLGELHCTLDLTIVLVSHDTAALTKDLQRIIYLGHYLPDGVKNTSQDNLSSLPFTWLGQKEGAL